VKQLAFMIVATLAGTVGVYTVSPFCGVFVYYLFAVLRPQFMWEWSLPRDVSWSFYVALATMGAAALGLLGVKIQPDRPGEVVRAPHHLGTAHWCVLLFAFWVGVTFLMARSTDTAWPFFEVYVKIFLMYFVSASLVRTVRQVWALFVMAGLALAYIAYEINYLYFVNHYLGVQRNGYGGLDNNGAGLMLAMGVPLCWFCYEAIPRWWRWGCVALIPTLVHAVLMTYSRGAMVALLAMCPFLVLRSRQRVRLSLALAGFAFLLIPVMAGAEIRARFFTLEHHELDASANSRRGSWNAAWNMAKDNPIFGVGIRNANLFSHQYGADYEGRTIHSQYLQIAADNGFLGLVLYLAVNLAAWISLRRCRHRAAGRTDAEGRLIGAVAAGVECSLVVFWIGSIFLSLELFELPYLLLLLAAQLDLVSGARGVQPEADLAVDEPSLEEEKGALRVAR
jgi:probable O-glycosylation ligase (exosortase A-associated)